MPSSLTPQVLGGQGILSKVKRTLKDNLLLERYFLTSETKHRWNQSRKRFVVLQAFLLYNQKTGSWCLSFPIKASLVAKLVKNPPAMQETRVWSLGQEDPLEKGMATHSSILAGKIPWKRSLSVYSPWGHKESDTPERLTLSLFHFQDFLLDGPEVHNKNRNCQTFLRGRSWTSTGSLPLHSTG